MFAVVSKVAQAISWRQKRGNRGRVAKGEGNIFLFRGSDVSEVGAFVSEHFSNSFGLLNAHLALEAKRGVGPTPSHA